MKAGIALGLGLLVSLLATAQTLDPEEALRRIDNQINENRNVQSQTEEELARQQRELAGIVRQVRSVSALLRELNGGIATLRSSVVELQEHLDRLTDEQLQLEGEVAAETERLDHRQSVLARRLREIFKWGGTAAYWRAIFAASDFSDLVSRLRFLRLVMLHDADMIRSYKAARDELQVLRSQVVLQAEEIDAQAAAMERERNTLERRRQIKETVLAAVEADQNLTQSRINELNRKAEAMRRALSELQARRTETEAELARRRRELEQKRGNFDWPVAGVRSGQILVEWGRRMHPEHHVEINHPGITIAASRGADVRSITDGEIAFAGVYPGLELYGKLVMIYHGGGIQTVYAHLGELAVQEGQAVTAGQVIGRVGSSGDADRPQLFFMLTENGQDDNPRRWLKDL